MSINIVIGGGFFLSASNVFASSGALAPINWLICGLILLPLVKVLASLSRLYPEAGGIYVYSKKTLGNFWGFFSGWGYFVGTAAGNAMLLHAFSALAQEMGFTLPISPFMFDVLFVAIFTILNLLNITILEQLSVMFTVLKAIPLGLVILALFFFFDPTNVTTAPIKPFGILESMPIVLFAFIGIEACCAISHKIKDGEKNAARAMLFALVLIMSIYALVQFGLLGILGVGTTNPFFEIIPHITSNPFVITWGNLLIKIAILSSFLGGFYSMFYANAWNLFALAKENTLPGSKKLTLLNKFHTPWIAVITQGLLIIVLLAIATKSYNTLMIMTDFGVVIAYILSAVTYFYTEKIPFTRVAFGSLALFGAGAFLILCLLDLYSAGALYLLPFSGIILLGIGLYRMRLAKAR